MHHGKRSSLENEHFLIELVSAYFVQRAFLKKHQNSSGTRDYVLHQALLASVRLLLLPAKLACSLTKNVGHDGHGDDRHHDGQTQTLLNLGFLMNLKLKHCLGQRVFW